VVPNPNRYSRHTKAPAPPAFFATSALTTKAKPISSFLLQAGGAFFGPHSAHGPRQPRPHVNPCAFDSTASRRARQPRIRFVLPPNVTCRECLLTQEPPASPRTNRGGLAFPYNGSCKRKNPATCSRPSHDGDSRAMGASKPQSNCVGSGRNCLADRIRNCNSRSYNDINCIVMVDTGNCCRGELKCS
jgi:hypothetical protein